MLAQHMKQQLPSNAVCYMNHIVELHFGLQTRLTSMHKGINQTQGVINNKTHEIREIRSS